MNLSLKWNILVCLIFASLMVGCKSEDEGSSSSGSVIPGVIDAAGGFNVKVNPPTGTNYYIHKAGDFDSACVVDAADVGTGLGNTFIDCIIEVEELEGAFGGEKGISMVMNVPPSMCKYVTYYPYFYFGLDFGDGPSAATANFDAEGDFISAGSSITGPGVFNSDGTVRCDYDYSAADGPNCCGGSMTYTSITPTATTVTDMDWGGKPGNCAAGAGALALRDEDTNMPLTTYYFKPNGFNDEFTTGKKSYISHFHSSLHYANYYSGAAPAAFKLADPNYPANPYYTWYCLDDAEEEIARIRVQIREWNDADEFALGATGDPDATGAEASGSSINDIMDWLDIVTTYADVFPGMPPD